jgi:hypothetical protein
VQIALGTRESQIVNLVGAAMLSRNDMLGRGKRDRRWSCPPSRMSADPST